MCLLLHADELCSNSFLLLFFTAKVLQQQPVIKNTLPAPCSSLQRSLYTVKSFFPKSWTFEQENNLYLVLQLHHHKLLM